MSHKQTPHENGHDPSPTTNTSPSATTGQPATTDTDTDDHHYRCPYCSTTYQTELNVRSHITRSDDVEHLNYNGFMPEPEIEIVAGDEVVDTISRRPEDIDPAAISMDDFPDDLSDQHKHILLEAAHNPYEETYTTIAENVEARLEDSEITVPSYSTVRRVIKQFYQPQTVESESSQQSDDQTLRELTPLQQSIVITRLLRPDEPVSKIADRVNCARSYPRQVCERADHILSDLDTIIEQSNDPEAAIRDELTDENIEELEQREFAAKLPISLEKETDNQESNEPKKWGSPSEEVMSAGPESCDSPDTHTTSGAMEQTTTDNTDSAHSATAVETVRTDSSSGEDGNHPIPRSEIETLKENVAFYRRIFDRPTGEAVEGHEMVVSLARQIETACETILKDNSS